MDKVQIEEVLIKSKKAKKIRNILKKIAVMVVATVLVFFGISALDEIYKNRTTDAKFVNADVVEETPDKNKLIEEMDKRIIELEEKTKNLENNLEQVRVSKLEKKKTVTTRGNSSSRSSAVKTTTEVATTEKWIWANVSAYCACAKCCGKTNGITASGAKAKANHTIAAPSTYKFGTKIEIAGMGVYTVEDRGGAIKGNKIDIYFNSHAEALKFGRRNLKIRVV